MRLHTSSLADASAAAARSSRGRRLGYLRSAGAAAAAVTVQGSPWPLHDRQSMCSMRKVGHGGIGRHYTHTPVQSHHEVLSGHHEEVTTALGAHVAALGLRQEEVRLPYAAAAAVLLHTAQNNALPWGRGAPVAAHARFHTFILQILRAAIKGSAG